MSIIVKNVRCEARHIKRFGKKEFKKLTLAKNMVMDVSDTTVAFLNKDKNANV